jgi:hypothetical protein
MRKEEAGLPCRSSNDIVELMPSRRDAQVEFRLLAASLQARDRFPVTPSL